MAASCWFMMDQEVSSSLTKILLCNPSKVDNGFDKEIAEIIRLLEVFWSLMGCFNVNFLHGGLLGPKYYELVILWRGWILGYLHGQIVSRDEHCNQFGQVILIQLNLQVLTDKLLLNERKELLVVSFKYSGSPVLESRRLILVDPVSRGNPGHEGSQKVLNPGNFPVTCQRSETSRKLFRYRQEIRVDIANVSDTDCASLFFHRSWAASDTNKETYVRSTKCTCPEAIVQVYLYDMSNNNTVSNPRYNFFSNKYFNELGDEQSSLLIFEHCVFDIFVWVPIHIFDFNRYLIIFSNLAIIPLRCVFAVQKLIT